MTQEWLRGNICCVLVCTLWLSPGGGSLSAVRPSAWSSCPGRVPWHFALYPWAFHVWFAFWKCFSWIRYVRKLPWKKLRNKNISKCQIMWVKNLILFASSLTLGTVVAVLFYFFPVLLILHKISLVLMDKVCWSLNILPKTFHCFSIFFFCQLVQNLRNYGPFAMKSS